MDQPHNDWLVQALRTAKAWGQRPTVFLSASFAGRAWSPVESALAMALDSYERTRVGAFGFPKRLTEGDWEGWFEVQTREDYAQQAYDYWKKDTKEEVAPGEVPFVVFTGSEGR